MENKMKQNKNYSVVFRVASSLLAAFVVLCSFSLPSFASSVFSDECVVPYVSGWSSSSSSSYTYWNDGLVVGTFSDSSVPPYKAVSNSQSYPIYLFRVGDSTTTSRLCAVCYVGDDSVAGLRISYRILRSSSSVNDISLTRSSLSGYSEYFVGYRNNTFPDIWNESIPYFSSVDDGVIAFASYRENGSSGGGLANPVSLTKEVPAGNALYIQIPTNATVSVSCSMSSEVAHPQSWITNQYWGTASGYPSSISGNPSGSTPISWNGYGDKTIFNRYKSFYWNNTVSSSGGYIFIVNPYASIDEYDQSFNPTIYVTVDQAKGYKYYQLTGGISSNGTIGQQSDGTTASGQYDASTGQWTSVNDDTGLPWTPSEGGGNLITTNSINDWLRTIATQISNFFQGAIGAVTTLVGAGSAFINQLISLYSWLPAPVYAVLSSALIIVITIGVIKVFV